MFKIFDISLKMSHKNASRSLRFVILIWISINPVWSGLQMNVFNLTCFYVQDTLKIHEFLMSNCSLILDSAFKVFYLNLNDKDLIHLSRAT